MRFAFVSKVFLVKHRNMPLLVESSGIFLFNTLKNKYTDTPERGNTLRKPFTYFLKNKTDIL